MAYVDAYVLPCPQDKVADYRRLARKAGTVWKDHGALQYMECVADDVEPGKSTSFPRAVKAKPGETVIVAFVVFRSRAARERINARVMADPRLASIGPKDMPFDTRRMFWGGFKPIVQA